MSPFSADWSPLTPTGMVTDGLRWWITLLSCRMNMHLCSSEQPKEGPSVSPLSHLVRHSQHREPA